MTVRALAFLAATTLAHASFATLVGDPVPRGLPRRQVPVAAVASNGQRALAAWIDDRGAEATIRATRIGEATALDPRGIILTPSKKTYGILANVWNGSEFVVFAPGNDEVVISRVAEDGRVLGTASAIPEPGVFIADSAVWNGSRYMLLVRERDAANSQHILVKLLVLDAGFRVERQVVLNPSLSESVGGCSIAAGGNQFAVVWERLDGNGSTMFVDRYDREGAPLPRQEVPTGARSANAPLAVKWPAISWNGSAFTIVWTNGGVFGASLSAAGVFGEPFRISAENGTFASIGWNGTQHLVTWTVTIGGPAFRLDGVLMTPAGAVGATRAIGTTSAGQAQASITSSGGAFALVWFTSIFTIDGTQRPLSSDFAPQSTPKIAGDASRMFVAWSEAGVVYGSRLGPDGTPLDGAGIALGALPEADIAATYLSVTTNGEVYLVVWTSSRGLSCARVTRDGVVLDPGGVTIVPNSNTSAIVATDGSNFLIATTDLLDVAFARIPASGTIKPKLLAIDPPKLPQFPRFPLALAWNGESYSLLWSEVTSSHCGVTVCTSDSQRRMTRLADDDSMTTNDVTVEGAVVGLKRIGNQLLYISIDSGFFSSQRLAIDGTARSAKFPVGDTAATTPAILTETSTGFAIIHPSPKAVGQLAIVYLNGQGRWTSTQSSAVPPDFTLSDATGIGGSVAVAYTTTVDLGEELRRAFTTLIRSNQGGTRQRAAHH